MIFQEEPESIFCKFEFDAETEVTVRADMILNYSKGKTAFGSSIFGSYYQSTYSVLGTKANVRMGRAYAVPRDSETKIFLEANDTVEEITVPPADHFRIMVDDFCEEILRGDHGTRNYEEDLLAQARVFEAAKISAAEKRLVTLSEVK